MRYKIKVEVHSLGEHTEYLIKAIAAHNAGLRTITPFELCAYLKVRAAIFPNTVCDLAYINSDNDLALNISSDKETTYSLTLEWVEIYELANDIPGGLFTTGNSDTEQEVIEETQNI